MTEVDATRGSAIHPAVAKIIGGKRGIIDGGLPPIVFVATNALSGLATDRSTSLTVAASAAVGVAAVLVLIRLVRRESLKQAAQGLAGLAIAVGFAVWSGEARDFFLPGMYVDAVYGIAFAASVLVGWPLVGVIYGLLFQTGSSWRHDRRLRRIFTVATLAWSAVYALRTGVQLAFYGADRPELLAVGKLLLGWPLTVMVVGLTLAAVRRAER
ncbi:DUF3159 domain-containing protein [Nocardioides astragali]|uniref:DUF3159 domain-containing protein n=1 Tax=Nocardioides astragali TaxID=1776736 RepID=A0ABW2N4D5_9ACTN|nr:DUF3159 domain-containing protein [Nocardioides astragali]